MSRKKTLPNQQSNVFEKTIPPFNNNSSTENLKTIWVFDKIDKNGDFSFDLNKPSFDHFGFLSKMIEYSNQTWAEVRKATHDQSKSKHHFIAARELSKSAQKRFKDLKLDESSDAIFSFSFNNKLRIIGIRESQFFHVIWYDANHSVCPSNLKHT